MLSWNQTLINVNNNDEHQLQCHHDILDQGLIINSVGRYTVTLSRREKALDTNQHIVEEVKEEYGLEDDQLQIQNYNLPANPYLGGDLALIMERAQVKIGGNIEQFKLNNNISNIQGYRKLVNDGNTIIYHFWDNHHHYVLLHQIKYN